jgi:hypothetical protein
MLLQKKITLESVVLYMIRRKGMTFAELTSNVLEKGFSYNGKENFAIILHRTVYRLVKEGRILKSPRTRKFRHF